MNLPEDVVRKVVLLLPYRRGHGGSGRCRNKRHNQGEEQLELLRVCEETWADLTASPDSWGLRCRTDGSSPGGTECGLEVLYFLHVPPAPLACPVSRA